MPNTRPRTKIRCTWRPDRAEPRIFTVRDVGRLACRLIQSGRVTRAEVDNEIDLCGGRDDRSRRDFSQTERAVAQQFIQLLQANDLAIRNAIGVMTIVIGVLTGIQALTLLPIPGAAGLRVAARSALVASRSLQTQFVAQRAANDAFFRTVLRRAA